MFDKNGNTITDGCLLRIKFKRWDNEQFDGAFKVHLDPFVGLECTLIELFEPNETFVTKLTWLRGDFCVDYKNHTTNPNYRQYLAIDEKRIGNGVTNQHYSNDIEIYGFYTRGTSRSEQRKNYWLTYRETHHCW